MASSICVLPTLLCLTEHRVKGESLAPQLRMLPFACTACSFELLGPLRMATSFYFVIRSTTLCIAQQNLSNGVNVVYEGSPSRMRRVRLISLGITIRPRSSTRRTIPVAFIYIYLLILQITMLLFVKGGDLYCNFLTIICFCDNILMLSF